MGDNTMIGKVSLAGARTSACLTQADLADKLGVSRVSVNQWETGKASIKPAYLYAICYICGFKTDDIFLPHELT